MANVAQSERRHHLFKSSSGRNIKQVFFRGSLHTWWVHQVLWGRGWGLHKLLHLRVLSVDVCGCRCETVCVDVCTWCVWVRVRDVGKP